MADLQVTPTKNESYLRVKLSALLVSSIPSWVTQCNFFSQFSESNKKISLSLVSLIGDDKSSVFLTCVTYELHIVVTADNSADRVVEAIATVDVTVRNLASGQIVCQLSSTWKDR